MAAIAGYGGLFKTGSNTITTVTDWELDIKSDVYDVTTIQNVRAKSFIAGLYEWSGTLKMNWDASDTNGMVLFQNQILNAAPSSQAVTLSTNNATNNYTGNVWVKDFKVGDAVNKQVSLDISFQGTGALSYA
jgi:hypothetical protein